MDEKQLNFLKNLKEGDEFFCEDDTVEYRHKPVIFQELIEGKYFWEHKIKVLENNTPKVLEGNVVLSIRSKEDYTKWLLEKIEFCEERIKKFNKSIEHVNSLLKELE